MFLNTMNISKELIVKKKYEGKVLVIKNYTTPKSELYVDDLLKLDSIVHEIYEFQTSEATLTDDGLAFIKDFYGIENLAKELIHEDLGFQEEREIIVWLKQKCEWTNKNEELFHHFVTTIKIEASDFFKAMHLSYEEMQYDKLFDFFRSISATFLKLHSENHKNQLNIVLNIMKKLIEGDGSQLRDMSKYFFFKDIKKACLQNPSLKKYLPSPDDLCK
jgi:hypothetical protein